MVGEGREGVELCKGMLVGGRRSLGLSLGIFLALALFCYYPIVLPVQHAMKALPYSPYHKGHGQKPL